MSLRRRTGLLDRTRQQRDASIHHVATEDTLGPERYFAALEVAGITDPRRVRVVSVPTPPASGRSAPGAVVDRLREHLATIDEIAPFDGRWVLLDVDHHFDGAHQRDLGRALQDARQLGAEVLVSDPCFEVWLLFHVVDRPAAFARSADVATALSMLNAGKDNIPSLKLTRTSVERACATARSVPEKGIRPENPGSAVWRRVERLLAAR